ncbi:MAG: formylglycine-generating enzyme family protein [bacterium]|nr:formylglycine-generating enzyme family protein [bacterium]
MLPQRLIAIRRLTPCAGAVLLVVLAACGDDTAPPAPAPKPVTAEAKAQLAEFASPATWEDLDPEHPGRRLRDPRTGLVFVRIAAGSFDMGGGKLPTEQPRHEVTLTRDYLIAETEFSVAAWQQCVDRFGADPAPAVPEPGDGEQAGELPMPLSFEDAMKLAQTLSYRLPTEAEWEFACTAGRADEELPWRDETGMRAHAWFHRNADFRIHPVGKKAANALGLHDMLGNLWEWCIDDFSPAAYGIRVKQGEAARRDPVGTTKGRHRVIRGGSWFSTPPATPRTRSSAEVNERNAFFGVRFACDAPPR